MRRGWARILPRRWYHFATPSEIPDANHGFRLEWFGRPLAQLYRLTSDRAGANGWEIGVFAGGWQLGLGRLRTERFDRAEAKAARRRARNRQAGAR